MKPGSKIAGVNCDLLDQLAFYGAYHSNKWNQLIHFVFVPAILWTVAVWLAYTPAVPYDLAGIIQPYLGPIARCAVLSRSVWKLGPTSERQQHRH